MAIVSVVWPRGSLPMAVEPQSQGMAYRRADDSMEDEMNQIPRWLKLLVWTAFVLFLAVALILLGRSTPTDVTMKGSAAQKSSELITVPKQELDELEVKLDQVARERGLSWEIECNERYPEGHDMRWSGWAWPKGGSFLQPYYWYETESTREKSIESLLASIRRKSPKSWKKPTEPENFPCKADCNSRGNT